MRLHAPQHCTTLCCTRNTRLTPRYTHNTRSGLNITSFRDDPKAKSFDPTGMARFTIKVAALLLSSFEEVTGLL